MVIATQLRHVPVALQDGATKAPARVTNVPMDIFKQARIKPGALAATLVNIKMHWDRVAARAVPRVGSRARMDSQAPSAIAAPQVIIKIRTANLTASHAPLVGSKIRHTQTLSAKPAPADGRQPAQDRPHVHCAITRTGCRCLAATTMAVPICKAVLETATQIPNVHQV